ncbi:porin [Archangium sp.]|uniref:porin n=1 Tax=Archangium sp. TaxID=1872627 RepID=UPI003899C710
MGAGRWGGKGRRGLLATVLLLGTPVLAGEPEPEPGLTPELEPAPEPTPTEQTPAELASNELVPNEVAPAVAAPKPEKQKPGKHEAKPGEAVEEPLSEGGEGTAAEEEDKQGLRVRPFGRVYARVSADEREQYTRSLSIPSARVGLAASLSHVDAEVTADLSSKSILKDAFVRVSDGHKRLRLYAGQFKAPFLERELASSWMLPVMERGLVADYLVDTHNLGGRRLGVMGEASIKQAWKLKVSGGVFQGAKDKDTDIRASEDAALRVSVRPFKHLTLGASSYVTEVFTGARNYAMTADAALRLGALELSGEYVTGRIPVGPFDAQLGLASYTLPLGLDGWAVQPVVGAETLRLLGPLKARGYGLVGGLNVLYSEHFKAQLQAEHALRPGDEAAGIEYSMQLAMRF